MGSQSLKKKSVSISWKICTQKFYNYLFQTCDQHAVEAIAVDYIYSLITILLNKYILLINGI